MEGLGSGENLVFMKNNAEKPVKLVNQAFQRNANFSLIMRTIRDHEPISRIDISRMLDLHRSTVTNITADLLRLGVLEVIAEGPATPRGGRKPELLRLRRNFGLVAGLDLRPEGHRIVLMNIAGEMVKTLDTRYPESLPFEAAFQSALDQSMDEAWRHGLPVIGVGVGIPGTVDSESGIIIRSVCFDSYDYDFSRHFVRPAGIPMIVENDANCCAWGELRNSTPDGGNFLFLLLKFHGENANTFGESAIGIGFGIAVNGNILSGRNHLAGEFLSVFWDGRTRGQLGLLESDLRHIRFDPAVQREAIREVFVNLAMFASFLDTGYIVVGGDACLLREIVKGEWDRVFRERFSRRPVEYSFRFSTFGENDVAAGAARMFLEKLFMVPELEGSRRGLTWDSVLRVPWGRRGR